MVRIQWIRAPLLYHYFLPGFKDKNHLFPPDFILFYLSGRVPIQMYVLIYSFGRHPVQQFYHAEEKRL
jgi:hypothetical protein